jgi:hypothetical protein
MDGAYIETGGDAIRRWANINSYLAEGKLIHGVDHHSLRWAINLPIGIFLSWFDGYHPELYHVALAFFGGGVAVFTFLLVRNSQLSLLQDIAIVIVVMAIMAMSINERAYTQLLPDGISVFYILGSLLFLKLAFSQQRNMQYIFLVIAGIFALFAYGAKLTTLWFLVPVTLFLLVYAIRSRQMAIFVFFMVPIVVGGGLETIILSYLTDFHYGRALYVVSASDSHGDSLASNLAFTGFRTFSEYIASPKKYYIAYGNYSFVIYLAIFVVVVRLLLARLSVFEKCFSWVLAGFFILQSYVVVNVSPYIFPEYFTVLRYQYPLLVLSITYWAYLYVKVIMLVDDRFSFEGVSLLLSLIAVLFLLLPLSNSLLVKVKNYGLATTSQQMETLNKWFAHKGNVGYVEPLVHKDGHWDLRKSVRQFNKNAVVKKYLARVYHQDYCFYEDAYFYRDNTNIYGLCQEWKPNSSVLIFGFENTSYILPKDLIYLGRYQALANQ